MSLASLGLAPCHVISDTVADRESRGQNPDAGFVDLVCLTGGASQTILATDNPPTYWGGELTRSSGTFLLQTKLQPRSVCRYLLAVMSRHLTDRIKRSPLTGYWLQPRGRVNGSPFVSVLVPASDENTLQIELLTPSGVPWETRENNATASFTGNPHGGCLSRQEGHIRPETLSRHRRIGHWPYGVSHVSGIGIYSFPSYICQVATRIRSSNHSN